MIDEVHHLLGKPNEPVNLFLKGFLQDEPAICPIYIGTGQLREFLFDMPENLELQGRLHDLCLDPFEEGQFLGLLDTALSSFANVVDIQLAEDITSDPEFARKIYKGCKASFGRCMRLIAMSTLHAYEDGSKEITAEDFSEMFDLSLRTFNPINPFIHVPDEDNVEVTGDNALLPEKPTKKKPSHRRSRPQRRGESV